MGRKTDRAFVGWLLHRITGVLLILLLALHFGYMHFLATWPLRFEELVSSPFLRAVDISLLAVVIYHTAYGVRAWLLDFNVSDGARLAVTALVSAGGLALFALGVRIFTSFLS